MVAAVSASARDVPPARAPVAIHSDGVRMLGKFSRSSTPRLRGMWEHSAMVRALLRESASMAADSREIRPSALALPLDVVGLRRARTVRPSRIVGAMTLAIVACGGAAYWVEYHEIEASRIDFAHEQITLAKGIAGALAARFQSMPRGPSRAVDALREVVATVESICRWLPAFAALATAISPSG